MSRLSKFLNFPENEIVETKEAKKSKANEFLKDKMKWFHLYVRNILYLNVTNIESEFSEYGLIDYINYLNTKKIYLEEARASFQEKFAKKMDNMDSDYKAKLAFISADIKNDEYNKKIEQVDQKLEEAQALANAREAAKDMDLGEETLPFDNEKEVQPDVDTPIAEEASVVSETVEKPHIEQTEEEKKAILNAWVNGEPTKMVEPQVEVPVVETPAEVAELPTEIKEVKELPVEDIKKEEPKTKTEILYEEYVEKINNIKNECAENIEKQIGDLLARFKAEADKTTSMQLLEMSNIAKTSINEANANLERTKEEKSAVEQDRDQYKSHYEQTLTIVSEKENIIKSKDQEISSLNTTITDKDAELKTAAKKEAELMSIIAKQKDVIFAHEEEIERKNNAIAEMMTINAGNLKMRLKDNSSIEETKPVEQTEEEKAAILSAWVNDNSKVAIPEEESTKTR